jgi:hypothetical protein
MDLSLMSPIYDGGNGRHFYVNELAQLNSLELVIPI